MHSTVRASSGTYLPFQVVDLIARYTELKIAGATGELLENSEPMSILCYAPGQYYRPQSTISTRIYPSRPACWWTAGSLHAGDPVEQGSKWVVTKWFRERRTQYLEF